MRVDDSTSAASSVRPDVLIIAPSFHETSGGAAVYYRLLVRLLRESGVTVEVVGDSGGADLGEGYHPLLPRRCDLAGRGWSNRLAYAAQNVAYLRLPKLVATRPPDTILFHSSFLNFPGLFPLMLRRARDVSRPYGTRIIADVRDRLLPRSAARHMGVVDAAVACSEGVHAHLADIGITEDRIHRIPVIQPHPLIDSNEIEKTLVAYGLEGARYMLYVGLVKEEKGVDILLQSFLRHVRPHASDVSLVICGQLKTARRDILSGLGEQGVRYLGPISRDDALALEAGARLNVSLSRSEGLSRTCLESVALGRPTVFPRDVPEFSRHCPEFVPDSYDPASVGEMLLRLIKTGAVPNYPIEQHAPEAVLEAYLHLLAPQPNKSSSSGRTASAGLN